MNLKNRWFLLLSFVLIFGVLAACSGNNESSSTNEENEKDAEQAGPQKGGTVIGAMDTAPSGQFNPVFYEEAYEANILDITHEALVGQDKTLGFIPQLAKDWTFNEDHTEVTFHLQDNVTWHDGEPFTADDVVFTYKILSSPGYIEAGGIRSYYAEKLLGYEEFSSGESSEFQGVVAEDDLTVTFKFAEPNVKALSDAAFKIIPEHIFKDIPIADMPAASASRNAGEVIGTGPFKFTEMVQGEQYVLEKHADYWQGEPYLDSVIWRVVDQAVILGLLENGEIDFVAEPNGFQAADYEIVEDMEHIEIIEQADFGYQIMGMMVNHRAKGDMTLDPSKWTVNEKLKDQKVRQAIAYAVDRQGIIDGLLYGKGTVQNSPIATQFWAYDDTNPPQYEYDPEQAKELLEEAGYVDLDGDGFRENPDGEEWILNLNYPTGNQLRERSAPIIEEFLEEVGINIDLRQPKEAQSYFEDLEKNAQDWDFYLLGWSLDSTDPDPSGLWSSTAAYNYSRWHNPDADALLKEASTAPDAFEEEFRKQKYSEWQVEFGEDLPALILYAQNKLYAHNSRLKNVDVLPYNFINKTHLWYVTE
ncbi:peptide-binding protein [Bacillus dakarensis]|uniref:peptide-binding protein n=1 Tax=Robertmurraya dakarensis TaxID=1926278 RepID=UPI000981FE59|nr:peptide-binding protein [Bacillus dakarensis]